MHKLAKAKGGKCLSTDYVNTDAKIKWQCKNGHQWESRPASVKKGYWCPGCAGMQKGTIEGMCKIAEERGGKCLSKEYFNSSIQLTWKCKQGHQWKATPGSVKSGKWCPVCGRSQRATIEEMQAIAKKRSGRCLSKHYVNGNTKLTWQCKNGHQWDAVPRSIKHQKSWCPICRLK